MNTPKFTPGPWGVISAPLPVDTRDVTAVCFDGGYIAYMDHDDDLGTGAEANAALIAAAPDLYAACLAVLDWAKTPGDHGGNPYCKEFVNLAEAAIARAEGRAP